MASASSTKEEEEENKEAEPETKEMKPWEQHAGVINMPRFNYNAPSALLHRSLSGFLITCSIKREKSATKEAISILDKYVGSLDPNSEESCVNGSAKRRKTEQSTTLIKEKDEAGERCSGLSLVKLTRSGLVLLTLLKENSLDTVDIVCEIFQCLESGTLSLPVWCHRICPIQATCCLNEEDLRAVVSKLALQFMSKYNHNLMKPIKFAIGYNRRGLEESQPKISGDAKNNMDLLHRSKCFNIVAAAFKDVVPDSSVDLKSPELSIFVELLPLSGLPSGSLVAAVSVLPRNLVSVKPRLCMKPLTSEATVRKGKTENFGNI